MGCCGCCCCCCVREYYETRKKIRFVQCKCWKCCWAACFCCRSCCCSQQSVNLQTTNTKQNTRSTWNQWFLYKGGVKVTARVKRVRHIPSLYKSFGIVNVIGLRLSEVTKGRRKPAATADAPAAVAAAATAIAEVSAGGSTRPLFATTQNWNGDVLSLRSNSRGWLQT